MNICSGNKMSHDEIVFECVHCPTCQLLEENKNLKDAIYKLEETTKKLEDTIFKLEDTIKELEDKADMDK